MINYFLRRKKLGKTSTEGIANYSNGLISVYRNDDNNIPEDNINVVIRWGCTSNIIGNPNKIINKSKNIHRVNNKSEFRKLLNQNNLCPKTYFNVNEIEDFNDIFIIRPSYHAQGRDLYVTKNKKEIENVTKNLNNGYYISNFIDKEKEYRVFFGFERVVWIAEKTPGNPEQIAWNVAQGGRFDNVRWGSWPLDVIRTSYEAFKLSGLDFGAVDVMVDKKGRPWVLEINSAPSQTSPYRQECVSKMFCWHINNNMFDNIQIQNNEINNYKDIIHPCLL